MTRIRLYAQRPVSHAQFAWRISLIGLIVALVIFNLAAWSALSS